MSRIQDANAVTRSQSYPQDSHLLGHTAGQNPHLAMRSTSEVIQPMPSAHHDHRSARLSDGYTQVSPGPVSHMGPTIASQTNNRSVVAGCVDFVDYDQTNKILRLKREATNKDLEIIDIRSQNLKLQYELDAAKAQLVAYAEKAKKHAEEATKREDSLRDCVTRAQNEVKRVQEEFRKQVGDMNKKVDEAYQLVQQCENDKERMVSEKDSVIARLNSRLNDQTTHIQHLRQALQGKNEFESRSQLELQCYLNEVKLASDRERQDIEKLIQQASSLEIENQQLRALLMGEKQKRYSFKP